MLPENKKIIKKMDNRSDFEQIIEMPDLAHFRRIQAGRPRRCASFGVRHIATYERPSLTVPVYQVALTIGFLFGLVLLMEHFLRQ